MAKHGQQKQETSANDAKSKSVGRQAVVELCEISACGLVFWSRRRFEIGAEVQVRIRHSDLPTNAHNNSVSQDQWVTLKGFVVACPRHRREDGSSGFHVSLLIEQQNFTCAQKPLLRSKMRWLKVPDPWMCRFGPN